MSTLRASDLDTASRSDLIARAEAVGIDKADVLTRAELIDEIVKRTVADPIERRLARGLLGVARDLVARVVERGLHLPDAAALIRGLQQVTLTPVTPPIATVTLAEIYAGQGHRARALAVLDEVLANEPEHSAARSLREKVGALRDEAVATAAPSEPPPTPETQPTEVEPDPRGRGDGALDLQPGRDRDRDRDHDRDRDRDRDHDLPPNLAEAAEPRDTQPPASDALPTLIPQRRDWRADTDRVVLVPVDATSALAYWELQPATIDAACGRAQGGELILRIVAVTPSWDGPSVEVRDIEVEVPAGDWLVSDLPAGAVVRAAVGWRSEGGVFDPLAVALDIASGGADQVRVEVESGAANDSEADEPVRAADIEQRARSRARLRSAQGCGSSWPTLAFAPWEAPYEPPAPVNVEVR